MGGTTPETGAALGAVTTFLLLVLAVIVIVAATAYGVYSTIRRARGRRTAKRP